MPLLAWGFDSCSQQCIHDQRRPETLSISLSRVSLSACRHHHLEQRSLCLPSLLSLTASASALTWKDASGHSNEEPHQSGLRVEMQPASLLHSQHICTHTANCLSCCQVRVEIKHWRIARISLRIQLPQFSPCAIALEFDPNVSLSVTLDSDPGEIYIRINFLSSMTSVNRKPISSK